MRQLDRMRLRVTGAEEESREPERRLPTVPQEWIAVIGGLWFAAGLYVDGWAHNHLPSSLETFFTPWHAVFYAGYFGLALALLGIAWVNRRRDAPTWLAAIPVGYGWSLIGAGVFFVGGIGDMAWHQIFGVEANIDALLSPTHLILAIGMFLMVTGSVRSWWARQPMIGVPRLIEQLPMLLSLGFALSLLTFMTQFAHPLQQHAAIPQPSPDFREFSQMLGVAGYLLQTVILMGCVLIALRKTRMAVGAFTLLFTLNALAMGWMRDGLEFVPSFIVAGILADYAARKLHPLEQHVSHLRAFAFGIPAALLAGYFITIAIHTGIWWSVHLWAGSIVIAGIAGLLLSFVAVPTQD